MSPQNAPLFTLDDRDQKSALAEAAGAARGRRRPACRPQDRQAAGGNSRSRRPARRGGGDADPAQKAYDRNQTLKDKAVASAATLDQIERRSRRRQARVDAAQENRAVAELAGRPDAIEAAPTERCGARRGRAVGRDAADAAQPRRSGRRAGRRIRSSASARSSPAGQPVVSLLPEPARARSSSSCRKRSARRSGPAIRSRIALRRLRRWTDARSSPDRPTTPSSRRR